MGLNFILQKICNRTLQLTPFLFFLDMVCINSWFKKEEREKKGPSLRRGFTVLTAPPINHLPIRAWKSTATG